MDSSLHPEPNVFKLLHEKSPGAELAEFGSLTTQFLVIRRGFAIGPRVGGDEIVVGGDECPKVVTEIDCHRRAIVERTDAKSTRIGSKPTAT